MSSNRNVQERTFLGPNKINIETDQDMEIYSESNMADEILHARLRVLRGVCIARFERLHDLFS